MGNETHSSRHSMNSNSGVLMVGPNYRVGKKIGCGNFGELRLGKFLFYCYSATYITLEIRKLKKLLEIIIRKYMYSFRLLHMYVTLSCADSVFLL